MHIDSYLSRWAIACGGRIRLELVFCNQIYLDTRLTESKNGTLSTFIDALRLDHKANTNFGIRLYRFRIAD